MFQQLVALFILSKENYVCNFLLCTNMYCPHLLCQKKTIDVCSTAFGSLWSS